MTRIFLTSWLGLAAAAAAERVHLEFTALVQTVSGDAFGLMVPRLTEVTGHFGYHTTAVDSNGATDRGDYENVPDAYFMARFLGNTISGSSGPFLQVEDFRSDTFRFIDGDEIFDRAGTMSLNGVPDEAIELLMAITDNTGQAFGGDGLPAPFPFRMHGSPGDPPHTFKLTDPSGNSLSLQFTKLAEVRPPTLQIRHISLTNNNQNVNLDWISEPGVRYTVQWFVHPQWTNLTTRLPSQGYVTRFVDPLSVRFHGEWPSQILYRVIEER